MIYYEAKLFPMQISMDLTHVLLSFYRTYSNRMVRDESIMLFFPLIMLLSNSQKTTNYAEESAHYARMPRQKRLPLETVSDSFWCSFTRFLGLTVFSSVSTALWLLRFPPGGLAAILRFVRS